MIQELLLPKGYPRGVARGKFLGFLCFRELIVFLSHYKYLNSTKKLSIDMTIPFESAFGGSAPGGDTQSAISMCSALIVGTTTESKTTLSHHALDPSSIKWPWIGPSARMGIIALVVCYLRGSLPHERLSHSQKERL